MRIACITTGAEGGKEKARRMRKGDAASSWAVASRKWAGYSFEGCQSRNLE